jgi:hypothetical protein
MVHIIRAKLKTAAFTPHVEFNFVLALITSNYFLPLIFLNKLLKATQEETE